MSPLAAYAAAAAAAEPSDDKSFVRAIINILQYTNDERDRLQLTHRAMLNILDDFEVTSRDLQRVNGELTELDELKSEFVAMASHELRTPLTSITGFSSTMLDRWDSIADVDKYAFIQIIDTQAHRLARLVDGLLTISRIESGALTTNASVVNVKSEIGRTLVGLGVEDITVICDEALAVHADEDHVHQMLVNYVGNAIKHGRPPVTIECSQAHGLALISVRDCGNGVPVEFESHLFERFAQADGDHSRRDVDGLGRGAGLGLSIVCALVKAQGGEAWYEPRLPHGACFNLSLPLAQGQPLK